MCIFIFFLVQVTSQDLKQLLVRKKKKLLAILSKQHQNKDLLRIEIELQHPFSASLLIYLVCFLFYQHVSMFLIYYCAEIVPFNF